MFPETPSASAIRDAVTCKVQSEKKQKQNPETENRYLDEILTAYDDVTIINLSSMQWANGVGRWNGFFSRSVAVVSDTRSRQTFSMAGTTAKGSNAAMYYCSFPFEGCPPRFESRSRGGDRGSSFPCNSHGKSRRQKLCDVLSFRFLVRSGQN